MAVGEGIVSGKWVWYITQPGLASMNVMVLRCPMFVVCRNSMARICTCELLGATAQRNGVAVLNAKGAKTNTQN